MGIIQFLMDNYIYFAIGAAVLVLALIGYAIDSAKTRKLKREMTEQKDENSVLDIPLAGLENITLGETISKSVENNKIQDSGVNPNAQTVQSGNDEIESMLVKPASEELKG